MTKLDKNDEPRAGQCYGCEQETSADDDFCFGCEKYICMECGVNLNAGGHGHDPMDHLLGLYPKCTGDPSECNCE